MRSLAGLDSTKAAIQEDQLCAEYGSSANYSSYYMMNIVLGVGELSAGIARRTSTAGGSAADDWSRPWPEI